MESKKKVTAWIKGLEVSSRNDLPQTFADAFDAVFGRRHFSLRCFFRSSVASFAFVIILQILFMSLNPWEAGQMLAEPIVFLDIFLFTIILNLLPDYLSLLETRFILRIMTKTSSTLRILILVIADFIFTTVIIVVVLLVIQFIVSSEFFTEPAGPAVADAFHYTVYLFRCGFAFSPMDDSDVTLGIFFYSTYLTSFWIWLYVLGLAIARILARLAMVWSGLKGFLNYTEKPLRCLGFLSMILVTVIYILIPLFRLL